LLIGGKLNPLTVDAIASLIAITFDRYRSFASETKAQAAHQSEQLRTRSSMDWRTPSSPLSRQFEQPAPG
jgi:hypothetical protein